MTDRPTARPGQARLPWLAGLGALLAALAGAWILLHEAAVPPSPPGQEAAAPVAPAGPPAPDAAVPPPALPAPQATAPQAQPPEAAPDDTPEGAEASGPHEPAIVSPNTNLSFARRAGLHRAANPVRLTASVALAMEAGSGKLLYARNDQAILPIASLTKLLTAMVLLDARLPMNETIRITSEDVDRLRHSRSRLRVGTPLTRAMALHLALMSSENRAAHALARTYPGGKAVFVEAMNRKAGAIGMDSARFADPTGLTNENRGTAHDVAALVLAAAEYPLVRRYSTTKRMRVTLGGRRLLYLNSNRLVRFPAWPIALQKTGYILESGHCVTVLTPVRGRRVVLVLMDSGSMVTMGQDARRLRQWVVRHPDGVAAQEQPGGRTG